MVQRLNCIQKQRNHRHIMTNICKYLTDNVSYVSAFSSSIPLFHHQKPTTFFPRKSEPAKHKEGGNEAQKISAFDEETFSWIIFKQYLLIDLGPSKIFRIVCNSTFGKTNWSHWTPVELPHLRFLQTRFCQLKMQTLEQDRSRTLVEFENCGSDVFFDRIEGLIFGFLLELQGVCNMHTRLVF